MTKITYVTCFIIINQLVLWGPPVNYSTTLSDGDKDQFQSKAYHGTSCLELCVSRYENFSTISHHFQGTSETDNWTILCCIHLYNTV